MSLDNPLNRPEKISLLFREYRQTIRASLRRKGLNREDAEDLTQETFIRAQRIDDWSSIDKPRAYLLRIARNLLHDRARAGNRQVACADDDISEISVADDTPSPEQTVHYRLQYEELCRAIETLTPKVRRALILNRFFNLTYTEVAEAMSLSPRTVEKHIAKGLAECRRRMSSPTVFATADDEAAGEIVRLDEHRRQARRQ